MSAVRIEVFDKTLKRVGMIGAPLSMKASIRHNSVSTVDVEIDNDSPRLPDLLTEGAVIQVFYTGVTGPIISGPVTKLTSTMLGRSVVVTVTDQFAMILNLLGWPNPANALTAQTSLNDDRSGPAETIVKGVIQAAVTRLGLPYTVAPDLGRGTVLHGSWRMIPLADVLLPILGAGNVGLSVQLRPLVTRGDGSQGSPGWAVDCYAPRTYPRNLTDTAGTITDWTLERVSPSATRWVLGAVGTDTARRFYSNVDTAAETLWGPANVTERFIDASSIGTDLVTAENAYAATPNATTQAALTAAQQKFNTDVFAAFINAQKERGAVTSIQVTLSQTNTVQYGDAGLLRGDMVPVTAGTVTLNAVLSECTFTWDNQVGLVVTPIVGQVLDSARQLSRFINRLRRDVHLQQVK